jgi:hypothetical protein
LFGPEIRRALARRISRPVPSLARLRDFGSWLKRSPTADFDKLRQLFPAQTGKGALAEQMQLLHVPQTMLIGDQADYLIQVDNFEK